MMTVFKINVNARRKNNILKLVDGANSAKGDLSTEHP